MSYDLVKPWKWILFILDVIQFSLVNIVVSIYYFVKMIFPLSKKDIKGQLALVLTIKCEIFHVKEHCIYEGYRRGKWFRSFNFIRTC